MNILITGANGFLGSSLLHCLVESKKADDCIWLLTSKQVQGFNCILHREYGFTKGDFYRAGLRQIDCLIHMGSAVPKTREEFGTESVYKYSRNVINTAYLMRNIPSTPKHVVYISSVSVYKDEQYISEETEYQIEDMYGASKLMCEAFLKVDSEKRGYRLHILRLGQLYGEGEETYSKIVSSFVKTALSDKPICIFGTGDEKRTMLHVEDCAKYILQSIELKELFSVVNVTGSKEITVKQIAELVFQSLGKETNIVFDRRKTGSSITYNTEKMEKVFDLCQKSYEEGIEDYCRYYLKLLEG